MSILKLSNIISSSAIWKRVLKLAKNPIYMCYVVGTNIRLFAVIGYLSFQSKYIETEYKNTASFANLITGMDSNY